MRRYLCWIAVCAGMALLTVSGAEPGKEAPPLRLELNLVDGSHIVGTPAIASVPVQTPYAKLDLPLQQILSVKMSDDHETAAIDLLNGDKIKGVITLGPVRLDTLFGMVSVGVEHIRLLRRVPVGGEGPVAHWSFDDGTGKDDIGSSEAQFLPSSRCVVSPLGKSLALADSRAYARVTTPAVCADGWAAITLSIWIKPRQYTTYCNVICRGTDSQLTGYYLGLNPSAQGAFVVTTAAKQTEGVEFRTFGHGANTFPPADRWYHLVGTYDGRVSRCYVNGQADGAAQAKQPGARIWDLPEAVTHLGTSAPLPYRNWGDQYFDGLLDEVGIWQRALSAEEVRALYETTARRLEAASAKVGKE